MRPRLRRTALAAGFTLVEMILSASLMALVLGSAYLCLSAGFSAQKLIEPRADTLQAARVALSLISADLRCACTLPGKDEFLGMQRLIGEVRADNIDFATHNFTPAVPEQGDFCEVSIFLDKNPVTGQLSLWRRRNPMIAMDPLSGGRREELVTAVRGLQFEYYDGIEWYESWGDTEGRGKPETSLRYRGNLSGLPEAVRVTLSLDAESKKRADKPEPEPAAPPLVFMTVVKVNLATASSASSTSGTGSGATTGPGQAQGGALQPGGVP